MSTFIHRQARREQGLALIVALILLLVMTMVAVVAMRSTTLDLKMTTNTTLNRRAFQTSDGSRLSVGPSLSSHVFYRGWPESVGGTVPDTSNFVVPDEIAVAEPEHRYYLADNGSLEDLLDGTRDATEDMRFRADVNGDGELDGDDMFANIWVTRVAAALASGSGAAQGSGYLGAGVGAAGADAHVFLDVRSRGRGVGNAETRTGADFRVLIRN